MTQSTHPTQSLKERLLTPPTLLFLALLIPACLLRFWQITRIPPTLWVDEAWFSARGRDVVRRIDLIPITRPGLGVGDAPMQVYLAAAVQALGLSAPYSSRIASAVVGALTIALLYPVFIDLLQDEHGRRTARWMALIVTTVVAGLFAHLYASRVGMQYALGLAVTVSTVWLSWKALRPSKPGWAVAAGLCLGLSQYSYETARALPLLIGAWGLLRLAHAEREQRKSIASRLAAIAGFSALAFLPLAVFYVLHPDIYYLHMADVSQGVLSGSLPQVLAKVLRNCGRVLWGISVRGDRMPGRNLVGRPMFYPFLSLFLWPGLLLTALRAGRSASGRLFLLWAGLMLLPSALSDEAPAFNRMLPAAPALAAFVALAMVWVWRRATGANERTSGSNRQLVRQGLAALLGLGLALGPMLAAYDYFVRWANDPRLFDAMGLGPPRVADHALQLARTGRVYLTPASNPYVKHVYDIMLDGSPIQVVDGDVCLPLVDHPGRPVSYGVVTVADGESLPLLKSVYPGGEEIHHVLHPDGYAYAVFFQVAAGTSGPAPQYPARTEFSGGPTLIGYDLSADSARPGETVRLTLHWKGTAGQAENLVSFVHVGKGRQSDPMAAQHDAPICGAAYPTQSWREGEIILDTHTLSVAADTPGDTYDLAVGLYRASDVIRLPIERTDHPAQDNRVTIGTLTVSR